MTYSYSDEATIGPLYAEAGDWPHQLRNETAAEREARSERLAAYWRGLDERLGITNEH
jgi:hypothetical protein